MIGLSINLQNREKRFLRYLNLPQLLHALLSFFLLFEQLLLSRYVTTITLCGDIFSERFDRLPRDNLAAYSSLNCDIEKLSWYDLLHVFNKALCSARGLISVNDTCECIDPFTIYQYIQFSKVSGLKSIKAVVQ